MEQFSSTSLQKIIIEHNKQSYQSQIAHLFQKKDYQHFELSDFYQHSLYKQHPQFQFFTAQLHAWNQKRERIALPNFANTEYRANEFIYDTLRNATVQKYNIADENLKRLYQWYTQAKNQTLKLIPKKAVEVKVIDEQWAVRKTFKSNMPSEIDIYLRKIYPNQLAHQSKLQNKCAESSRKLKTEASCEDYNQFPDVQYRNRLTKLQHTTICTQRQTGELSKMQKEWKSKKSREDAMNIKSYYNGVFSFDKEFYRAKSRGNLLRIKASANPIKTHASKLSEIDINELDQHKLQENRFNFSQKELDSARQPLEKENNLYVQKRLQSVDGIRLITNPFDFPLKKKKRNG